MSKLLIALSVRADNAPLAERLADWIYQLNGKSAKGHLLLAWHPDVHGEYRAKITIAAELAFESVTQITLTQQGNIQNDAEQMNSAFAQVAGHIQSHFRFPWLRIEPDSVPLTPTWIEALANAYDIQPRRYCGSLMGTPDGAKLFGMARVGMYHPAAFSDLERFCKDPNVSYEFAAGERVLKTFTKTKLIQQLSITDDASLEKIRPDAVLLHGDKWGKVIKKLRAERESPPCGVSPDWGLNGDGFYGHKTAPTETEEQERVAGFAPSAENTLLPKNADHHPDLRTKAGRAWKASMNGNGEPAPLQNV